MGGVSFTRMGGVSFTRMGGVSFTRMGGVSFTRMGGVSYIRLCMNWSVLLDQYQGVNSHSTADSTEWMGAK